MGKSNRIQSQSFAFRFFEDVQEAYDTRLKAEEKYFGEYSYDNSMRYYQNIKDII